MAYIGMRGTGSWVNEERPKDWREMILRLYPNGRAPLTAILSRMSSKKPKDAEFYWWTKVLPYQRLNVSGLFTDSALTVAYAGGGVKGNTLYVKPVIDGEEYANIKEFRKNHQILLRYSDDASVDVNAYVNSIKVSPEAEAYIEIVLLEDDDNSATYDLQDCDACLVIGNRNAEGAAMPEAISYDAVKWRNFTQIFRTKYSITRTAYQTKSRTAPFYAEERRDALENHSVEMEKAFWFGIPTEETDPVTGQPIRTTMGIIPAIKGTYGLPQTAKYKGLISDYSRDPDYSGQTFLNGGADWLEKKLNEIFRYGNANNKIGFCGYGALTGINALVKKNSTYNIETKEKDYGIMVREWTTPMGRLDIIDHPLFSHEITNANMMVIIEPNNIVSRDMQPTFARKIGINNEKGHTAEDAITEEFLTETGLELHHPNTWGYLTGFNKDNTV
jgi:hypothetical protein